MVMANKGNSRHMKALNTPLYFGVERKGNVYVTKQSPGRFKLSMSIPLLLALDRIETGARNHSELREVIKGGSVKVNYKTVTDPRYPVGLNDIIELAGSGKVYRAGISKVAKFIMDELEGAPKSRMQKVVGKFKAKGNKPMIRLYDGTVISYGDNVNVNDTVEVDERNKVLKVTKISVDSKCFVYAGVHVGTTGTIKALVPGTSNREASAKIDDGNGNSFSTLLKNIMVIG